jgi:dTDP-4-dehydrorhamnose 3,5-epimerase
MIVESLAIPDVKLLRPRRHIDGRGFFSETYSRRDLRAAGVDESFVQDNHSLSVAEGVVRGLHFQIPPYAQAKLVRVVRGAIFDVVVDLRHGSPSFGQHVVVELSAADWAQLYVPPGFAHGFCTLEPQTEIIYKTSDYYAPSHERGIRWDDADLAIDWPVARDGAVLSKKDSQLPGFAALPRFFEAVRAATRVPHVS